jgi:pyruvate dehydrogenase E2 component (dihydrolipoamide acetyltransferase)
MAHAVRMPMPGQMTEECALSMWRVAVGEPVAKGDVLFEIETDKSTMEVESFHDGVLLARVVPEGATVPVNTICAWIGEAGEAVPEGGAEPEAAATAQVAATTEAAATAQVAAAAEASDDVGAERPATSPPAAAPATGRIAISPRAMARAVEAGLDPRSIAGTGPGHRIVERDVAAAIAARGTPPVPEPDEAPASRAELAGSAGRATPTRAGPDDDEGAPRPLSRMRRVIAERLLLSTTTIPTFTVTVAADVTRVLALRDELREAGRRVSVTDIVLAATAQTLAEFPDVNSRTDGVSVWPRRRVHLGIAVALPAGLVVAVIRDADRLRLTEIHDEAARLAVAARDGTLPVDDMTGSTFTVSNLGMYGVEAFAAIVNPGESGILAVGAAVPTPVAIGGGLAIRTLMRLTLTADHRLVDGELGARFLAALRRRLEDPVTLRSELASQ